MTTVSQSAAGPSTFRADTDLGEALLDWFDENRRQLPWREGRTPYTVWIAEIMLQQTRVDTVIPYYVRFLEAFPTVDALAAASEEDVLKLWEGLGYYSRARNMRKAAQAIVERFDGELPSDVASLRTLPGIGRYTAGAIASIAFNEPVPAVDGNVLRVVSRLAHITDVITTAAAHRQVEDAVRGMIPAGRASEMTEALMELGALVCVPSSPACNRCPWQGVCVAHELGSVDALPRRRERRAPRIVEGAVLVITDGKQILVRQRPSEGLLAGLWEFPWVEIKPQPGTTADPRSVDASAATEEGRVGETLRAQYGMDIRIQQRLPSVRHVFSHLEWRLDVFVCRVADATAVARAKGLRSVTDEQLRELPFGRAHRRIADEWLGRAEGGR